MDGRVESQRDRTVDPDAVERAERTFRERSDDSFEALLREIAAGAAGPPVPVPGEVIAGKYRIEEKLGQGGMGIVYRATHTISEKQVAIKWMLSASASEQGRSRFVREARAAARIDHENVVDVYDIGQDGDRGLYMVMQLLRGEPLARRIERGPIAVGEAIDILLPAMRGVAAVHAAGVIHRDLKPDNVFLCESRSGERRSSKVLDFGISAVAASDETTSSLTRDGMLLGTPAYMSPEQIQDSRSVDVRSDVYAFGVILYECLTGKLPFSADSNHALVHAIVEKEARDPRSLRPDIPPALARMVMRALAKSRESRFASVDEMVTALSPWMSSSAVLVPPTRSVLARKAPYLLVVGMAAIVAYGWWQAQQRSAPPATALSQPAAPILTPAAAPVLPKEPEPAPQAAPSPQEVMPKLPEPATPPAKPRRSAPRPVAPSNVPRSGNISIEEL